MLELLNEMKDVLDEAAIDIEKFINGTNAAAGRARKKMQQIKKMGQEMRIMIQDEKNRRKGGGKKVAKKKGKKAVAEKVVEKKSKKGKK